MDEKRKAGAVILRELGMLNDALMLFKGAVISEIYQRLNDTISLWADNHAWNSIATWGADIEDISIGAPDWKVDIEEGKKGDAGWLAWYELNYSEEGVDDSLDLANLCGVGPKRYGLVFNARYKQLGISSKKTWYSTCSGDAAAVVDEIKARGFEFLNNYFVLPVSIDREALVSAWENDDYTEVFAPLLEACETAKDASPLFQELIDKSRAASTPAASSKK